MSGQLEGLSDRVVAVTGGGAGIGLETVRVLVQRGARVAVLDLDPAAVPAGVLALVCDITDDAAVAAAFERIVGEYGGVDAVVNNAAIAGAPGSIEDNELSAWRQTWEVNVLGTVRVTRAALPYLRRSAAPVIVNTCSVVCDLGLPGMAMYSVTKGALKALTLATASDLLGDGIRVVAVAPGSTETINSAGRTDWVPIERLLEPREVAHVTAALLEASGATGVIWPISGGMGSILSV